MVSEVGTQNDRIVMGDGDPSLLTPLRGQVNLAESKKKSLRAKPQTRPVGGLLNLFHSGTARSQGLPLFRKENFCNCLIPTISLRKKQTLIRNLNLRD